MDNVGKQRRKTKTFDIQKAGDPYDWINEYFNHVKHIHKDKNVESWCKCQISINTVMSKMLDIDPIHLFLLDIETFFDNGIRESHQRNINYKCEKLHETIIQWLDFCIQICDVFSVITTNTIPFNNVQNIINKCIGSINVLFQECKTTNNDYFTMISHIAQNVKTTIRKQTKNIDLKNVNKLDILQKYVVSPNCTIKQLLGYMIKCASSNKNKYSKLFRYMYEYHKIITLLILPDISETILLDIIEMEDDLPVSNILKDSVVHIKSLIDKPNKWEESSTFPTSNRSIFLCIKSFPN